MGSSTSFGIGLTAQPNLYGNIYANKQAKAAADKQEQSKKFEKDIDKFRVDYSKIHPIHAREAKEVGAAFIQGAQNLMKEMPYTYQNSEEYNNLYFKSTAELEDLTNSSKVIYDEQKLRMTNPSKYETDAESMQALTNNNIDYFQKKLGRNRFQYGDFALEKWDEQAALKSIVDNTAKDELLRRDAKGNVMTTPLGSGTEDVVMQAVTTLQSPQMVKNTLAMFENDPAMQRKFGGDKQKALDWIKQNQEQGVKDLRTSIYHPPAGGGSGAAVQKSLTNNNKGHQMTFGYSANGSVMENTATAPMRASVIPSTLKISASPDIYNKTDGSRVGGSGQMDITIGEIAVLPVYKNYGEKYDGRVVDDKVFQSTKDKSKYFEYKVIYTGTDENAKTGKGNVYGDISQVMSALGSKESPMQDKDTFYKSVDTMEAEAKKLNAEMGGGQKPVKMDAQGNTYPNAPAVGTIKNGYKFKGGDPNEMNNWEKQ